MTARGTLILTAFENWRWNNLLLHRLELSFFGKGWSLKEVQDKLMTQTVRFLVGQMRIQIGVCPIENENRRLL